MNDSKEVIGFLAEYSEEVFENAMKLREIILENLPKVLEQVDVPARMVAYAYGQRYIEMVCTLIPSKKGLKLGFYKGVDLPDPEKLLQGKGKISRYVEFKSREDIKIEPLITLLKNAYEAYRTRNNK